MGKYKEIHANLDIPLEYINHAYLVWLKNLVGIYKDSTYDILLKKLYDIIFIWLVPNDDNRAADGRYLRERFVEDQGYDDEVHSYLNVPEATFLEVLIGIAEHMHVLADLQEDDELFFWELLENIGLTRFSDDVYHEMGGSIEVERIVYGVMTRDYGRNGVGGLFPLRTTSKDQRTVELWYQMHAYLEEKFNWGFW